jgi:uncharacterized membrane protein
LNRVFVNHWHHHAKLYASLGIGAVGLGLAYALKLKMPVAIGADVFFLAYIVSFALSTRRLAAADLQRRAKIEDEGAFIVSLLVIAAVAYTSAAIFATLNDKKAADLIGLAIVLAGAPLGWFVVHLNETLHYSNIYYAAQQRGDKPALDFHDDKEPGVAEFLYFSLVIGMTAQTSDVDVLTPRMRRAVTIHGVVSFFFNTILIAMAVNAVVAHAG